MPIYEYLCEECGTKFEKLVRRAADASELQCPSCGRKRLKQEYSTFAAHANGAGKSADPPTCPNSGAPCGNPGMCGMNFN
jgi:putative FmdB family regulatory protein